MAAWWSFLLNACIIAAAYFRTNSQTKIKRWKEGMLLIL